jgi:hypothetical protein
MVEEMTFWDEDQEDDGESEGAPDGRQPMAPEPYQVTAGG